MQAELAQAGVRLLAPYQTKKHDPDPARSQRLSGPRWRVETVQGQLTDRYRVKRVWARDLWHLCHRVIRKVLSHTVAIWLNVAEGLPMFEGREAGPGGARGYLCENMACQLPAEDPKAFELPVVSTDCSDCVARSVRPAGR